MHNNNFWEDGVASINVQVPAKHPHPECCTVYTVFTHKEEQMLAIY